MKHLLVPAVMLLLSVVPVEAGERVIVGASVPFLKNVKDNPPVFVRPGIVTAQDFLGSVRFARELTVEEEAHFAKMGLEFLGKERAKHIGTIYPARIHWAGLDGLLAHPLVVQVESASLVKPRPPLNITAPMIGATQIGAHIQSTLMQNPGEGTAVADLDSGIDVFHPAFFRPDGGHFRWLDVDGDQALTLGVDACDLNGDGEAQAGEILSWTDASQINFNIIDLDDFPGYDLFDPDGKFELGVDWLFLDENGNGVRDYGADKGFGEDDPAFGEPVLLADDVDGDGILDPDEKLVMLKTSKVAKVWVAGDEYVRGENLSTLDTSMFPSDSGFPGSMHGTGVAGIIAANTPGMSKYVGIAPYADLYMIDHSLDKGSYGFVSGNLAQMIWAREQGVKIMLYEFSTWGVQFMDGSSNMEMAMDELRQANGIIQVCPTGNLAASGKHMQLEMPAGSLNVIVDVPKKIPGHDLWPYETPSLIVSLYWYGKVEDFSLQLQEPEGEKMIFVATDMYNPLPLGETMLVASQATYSATNLVHRMIVIWNKNNKYIKTGPYKFLLKNESGEKKSVHGFLQDYVSGWDRATVFTDYESVDTTMCHPSTSNSALTVGAYGGVFGEPAELGKVRDYSSRGPRMDGELHMDITAPDDPFAPFPNWYSGKFTGDKLVEGAYMVFGGTSGAGPHVAGALALLMQLYPDKKAGEIEAMLLNNAQTEEHMGTLPNKSWGNGKVNVYKATLGVMPPDNKPPVAKLRFEKIEEYKLFLDASGATDDGAGALTYRWDIDYDGQWDTKWSPEPKHIETLPEGSTLATVKVQVADENGLTAQAVASHAVPADYTAPEPGIDPGPESADADVVSIDDSSGFNFTWDPDDSGSSGGGGGCNAVPFAGTGPLFLLLSLILGLVFRKNWKSD